MQCRQARAKISAYLDHELDAASSHQLELHLHQCAECREALNDFQERDDMVRVLPRIEPGTDFARQTVKKLGEISASGEIEHQGKLSVFKRLSRLAADFSELIGREAAPSTGTLDEFDDFPPLSMGSVYFKLISVNR